MQRAIRESQRLERPLWQLLLRESILPAESLFRLLRQAVRVPVLEEAQLEHVVVPDDLKLAIPPEQVVHQGVLPLERSTDGRRAALAMLDPTMDLTPLWPALARLGVVEVRRFLLSLPTLQRGRQMFYGQAWAQQLGAEPVERRWRHTTSVSYHPATRASTGRVLLGHGRSDAAGGDPAPEQLGESPLADAVHSVAAKPRASAQVDACSGCHTGGTSGSQLAACDLAT